MIPLRSRSDSWTFTPEPHAIRIESNFSRCPHNFWAKRGIGPGHPDYKQRMRDYAEMYGKNHGVPYDPKEEMLTPNEVLDISSGNTKLTAEEHNAALAQALREGKIGKR
jgi:hypothetical protein